MITVLACAVILSQAASTDVIPPHVRNYLRRCEEGKAAALRAGEAEIESLEKQPRPTRDTKRQLDAARTRLADLRAAKARPAPMSIPPQKDATGVLERPADAAASRGRFVDLLEVVGEQDAIVRLWYVPPPIKPDDRTTAEELTFIDVWIRGVDLRGRAPGSAVELVQVFHVSGSKALGTDCGQRSFLLLEVVDLERFPTNDSR